MDRIERRSSSVPQGLELPKSPRSSGKWTSSSPRSTSSLRLHSSSVPTTPRGMSPVSSPLMSPSSTPPETPRLMMGTQSQPRKTRADIYNEVKNMNHCLQSIAYRVNGLDEMTSKALSEHNKRQKERQEKVIEIKEMNINDPISEEDEGYKDFIMCYNKCIIL